VERERQCGSSEAAACVQRDEKSRVQTNATAVLMVRVSRTRQAGIGERVSRQAESSAAEQKVRKRASPPAAILLFIKPSLQPANRPEMLSKRQRENRMHVEAGSSGE